MIEIIPSILAKTKEEFASLIAKVEPFTERAHIDVTDGVFTADKTVFGYEELQTLDTKLKLDAHLMVVNPQEYLPQWFKTKADRIFIHAEAQGDLKELLLEIKGQNRKAGIVLNPETPVDTILEYLPMVDYVQFMTVHPGTYGAPFLADVVEKILNFHDRYPDIAIGVDGGMTPEIVKLVYGAGAQVIVSGSYIMDSADVQKAIANLKNDFT